MSESYPVQNISHGPITFMVFGSYEIPEGTPKHKRRKMTKGASQNVVIPPQQVVDLVEVTGLSVAELKGQPELNKILHNKVARLRLLDTKKAAKPESPPEEPDEGEVEDDDTDEPESGEESGDKPKKKTRTKKKKK